MKLARRFIAALRALIWRSRIERELDEELRTYLDAAVEAKTADGMPHHAAVRAARAEMGSAEAIKDHVRDVGWKRTSTHSRATCNTACARSCARLASRFPRC